MIFPSPDDSPSAPRNEPKRSCDPGPAAGTALPGADPAGFLVSLYRAMVAAANPSLLLPPLLPAPPRGRTVVIGAGKAAAAMARAVDEHWPAGLSGLAVTRYGHGLPCGRIEVLEAGHPLPDASCSDAAGRALALVGGLSPADLVLVLLSGGGSSLLTMPAPGLTMADLKEVNRQLLMSGAPIAEINCVRKHLSAISGGRLAAAAWPAEVCAFAISDVPGNDPAVIASGPTVADPSTYADALAVAEKYALDLPAAVRSHLETAPDETPKPGAARLGRSRLTLIATPASALDAAATAARAAGIAPLVLGAEIEGEARAVAAEHAALLRTMPRPALLLSGGETTVTVKGHGRGGRNTEYLLALALALDPSDHADPAGRRPVWALAADTDGIDGTEDNAGAVLRPDSLEKARARGLDPRAYLEGNDSYGFFAALGDLLVTGPTRTNVNDFRAVLVL